MIISEQQNILVQNTSKFPLDVQEAETVIRVKNLSKTFYVKEKSAMTIRRKAMSILRGKRPVIKKVEALNNVNFRVQRGEFLGIIGRNGSGKSTLLHLLIGAMQPDAGSIIETNGKVLRLAQGMNFEPKLTARDNIYLSGSILGLTFKRIGIIFDDIIRFAEIGEFVNIAVKNYSSGMLSKLKFAIAVHAEADILLMDEFFVGVGDLNFKSKSEAVFRERLVDGRTIIHVSHSLTSITNLCDRVLLLDKGILVAVGEPKEMVAKYKKLMGIN